MEKYYLAVDAGGSKVHLLFFDAHLNRIDFDISSSANPNVTPIPAIQHNMHKTLERLFARNPQIRHFEAVYFCSLCGADILLTPLEDFGVTYDQLIPLSEGEMGMYASGFSGSAVIALSGTGSDIYYVKDNRTVTAVGGWGAIVADEGSGYWIGREALIAAIHDFELRGEKTVIRDLLAERFEGDFGRSIFTIYESSSPARSVAAMSRLVDAAARKGDRVADDILRRAAMLLAQQTRTLYLKNPGTERLPLLVTGGSYKTYRLFSYFEQAIQTLYPGKAVQKPLFEPIVGGVFCHAIRMGLSDAQAREILKKNFTEDLYQLPQE